jgi:hypothetical protein
VVLYAPRAALSPSQDLTPWEPGPGELYFECEFITDGAAGGTSNRHIFKSTYCQKIPLPDSRLSINMVGFEQLKVSPRPQTPEITDSKLRDIARVKEWTRLRSKVFHQVQSKYLVKFRVPGVLHREAIAVGEDRLIFHG